MFQDKNRYKAQGRESGKKVHIGTFDTPPEAAVAYARRVGPARPATAAADASGAQPTSDAGGGETGEPAGLPETLRAAVEAAAAVLELVERHGANWREA